MALDRGTSMRIDRRVFAELAHNGGVRAVGKVGRNQQCACESGRKHKHCHGRAGRRT